MVCETIMGGGGTRISPQFISVCSSEGECQVGSLEAGIAKLPTLTNLCSPENLPCAIHHARCAQILRPAPHTIGWHPGGRVARKAGRHSWVPDQGVRDQRNLVRMQRMASSACIPPGTFLYRCAHAPPARVEEHAWTFHPGCSSVRNHRGLWCCV